MNDATKHLFTAGCLWEAALAAFEVETIKIPEAFQDQFVFERQLQQWREKHGTAEVRDQVTALAPDCDAAWDAMSGDEQEFMGCFDWDFVPFWLEKNFFKKVRGF